MDIKNLIVKNKRIVICLIVALGLGVVGGRGDMSKVEYNTLLSQKEQLDSQVGQLDKQVQESQKEVDNLQTKKDEADRLVKEEANRIAKEEAEKKAQEEAEKKAQEEAEKKAQEEANRIAQEQQNSNNSVSNGTGENKVQSETPIGQMVWLSATGSKYHSINNCGKMNPANARQINIDDAISQGFEACSKCH